MTTSTARRSPTAAELRTWREFIELSERIRAVIGARLQAESDLSSGDYVVMLALYEAGDRRLRSAELASKIGWDRTRVSHQLSRMEKRGLIARVPCASDTRGVEVVLTREGSSAFRRASAPHMHAIQELFVDALSAQQQRGLDDITAALGEHLTRVVSRDGT